MSSGPKRAKSGDTIEVLCDGAYKHKCFVVIECPNGRKPIPWCNGMVWIDTGREQRRVHPLNYRVIEKLSCLSKTTIDINADEFLKNQLDDNLRSVFG